MLPPKLLIFCERDNARDLYRGICIADESEEQQPPVVFVPVCVWFQRERIRLRAWAPVGFHRSGG